MGNDSLHRREGWRPGAAEGMRPGLQGHGWARGRRGEHRPMIHFTPEQRQQMMAINKDFRKRSEDLYKKDNIMLKEYKAGLVALQKEKKSKLETLLTPQQKEQIVRRKKMADENRQVAEAGRMERLKLRLNLSDDQVAKIKAGQTDLRTQFRSIHENDNLLPQQKMEQMKGLMAKRKDVFKTVLTPEQFSKFEEMSHRRGPGGRPGWDRGRHAQDNEGQEGSRSTTAI